MATTTAELNARPASSSPAQVNPWAVALTVTLATFMELLDTSIANVSLPHIAGGLGRSFDETTWVLTSYLVANAVVLPMSAWLSRVLGRKRYYMISVGLFTATSFLCGIAPSLNFLVIFRVLQGIGGGGLAPVEQAILVDTFPANKRAAAFALYSVAIVTAPAIGPPLGGWITDSFSWRWVFFINVPIGLISLFLSSRLVSDPPAFKAEVAEAKRLGKLRVDYVGIMLIALGFAFLEFVLDRGQIDDWFGSSLIIDDVGSGDCLPGVRRMVGTAGARSGGGARTAAGEKFRFRKYLLLPLWLCALRQHHHDSGDPAEPLRLHRHGRGAGPRAGRGGDHGAGADGRHADAKGQGEAEMADRLQLRGSFALDAVLQHVYAANQLHALCAGASAAGLWLCVLICAGKCACLFLPAAGQEQQRLEPYQSRAQLGRELRRRVHHHRA